MAQQLFAAQVPKETPTDKSAIEALPSVVISETHVLDKVSCSVCFDAFQLGQDGIRELPCEHLFHADCILPWLETHNTCPVCRALLPARASPAAPPSGAAGSEAGGWDGTGAGTPSPSVNPFALFEMLNGSGISFGGARTRGFGAPETGGPRFPGLLGGMGRGAQSREGGEEGGDGSDDDEDDGSGDAEVRAAIAASLAQGPHRGGTGEDEEVDPELRAAIAASLAEEREREAERLARQNAAAVPAVSASASSAPPLFSHRYEIPPEPIPGDADAFTIKLRFPDGSSVVRRFPPAACIGQVIAFVLSTDKRPLFATGPDGTPRIRLILSGGLGSIGAECSGSPCGPFTADHWGEPLSTLGLAGRRSQFVVEGF